MDPFTLLASLVPNPSQLLLFISTPPALPTFVSVLSTTLHHPQNIPPHHLPALPLLLFHSITCATTVILNDFSAFGSQQIQSLLSLIFSLTITGGGVQNGQNGQNGQNDFVDATSRRAAAGSAALLFKQVWLEPYCDKDDLFKKVEEAIGRGGDDRLYANTFLEQLVAEFGGGSRGRSSGTGTGGGTGGATPGGKNDSGGRAGGYHDEVRKVFQNDGRNGLMRCFEFGSVGVMAGEASGCRVLSEVCGWDWNPSASIGRLSFSDNKPKTAITPPAQWREFLLTPSLYSTVFSLVLSPRHTQHKHLVPELRKLLLQMASFKGDGLFPKEDDGKGRMEYAKAMLDGVCGMWHSLTAEGGGLENGAFENACFDICAISERLSKNLGLEIMSKLGGFQDFLRGIATMAEQMYKGVAEAVQNVFDGDLEMLVGSEEWKLDCYDMLTSSIAYLVDDTDSITAETVNSISAVYKNFIVGRLMISRAEERRNAVLGTDLDEVREDIAEDELNEQLITISQIGRVDLLSSLTILVEAFTNTLNNLKSLFSGVVGGGTNTGVVTPDAAALLEEARILIMAMGFLMTDANDGESPAIPAIILQINLRQPNCAVALQSMVGLLIQLGQHQATQIRATPDDPNLSPYLAHTILWFFSRFVPPYIIPDKTLYSSNLTTNNSLLELFR